MSRLMKCEELETLWIPYLDGRLAAEDRARVDAHLARCPLCEEQRLGLLAVSEALDAWPTPDPAPWFNARLHRRVAEEVPVSFWARPWRSLAAALLPRFPVSVAALMVLATLLLLIGGPGQTVRPREVVFNDPQKMEDLLHVVDEVDLLNDAEFLGELNQPTTIRHN